MITANICQPCRFMKLRVSIPVISDGSKTNKVTIDMVARMASTLFHVPFKDLKVNSKKRENAEARFMVFSVCRLLTKQSLKAIGDYFGKDHATVIYGCRQNDILKQKDIYYSANYYKLLNHFQQQNNKANDKAKVKP
jgi:chromosomal replication initiation ATPase DnaA